MRKTWYRFVLPGLVSVALVVSALVATGPPAAAALPYCATPAFLGLHGMGEGPDLAQPALAYSTLLGDLDDAQNAISGAVGADLIPYQAVSLTDWNTLKHPSKALIDA